MPWYDMPWFVFRLTNRWGWKWLNPTQPAVVALWIIFCSFHSKIQIILSQSYWIMITFDGAMLRCSELPPDVQMSVLFPGFRDSFSLFARYLLRFAQYSGFPCVVKSWRGISCNLSSARPETWDLHAVKDFRPNYGGKEKMIFYSFHFQC